MSESEGERPGRAEETWDLMDKFGRKVLDRYSERARHNLQLARNREYGLDSWLDDMRWFWTGLANDATEVVDGLSKVTRPKDGT